MISSMAGSNWKQDLFLQNPSGDGIWAVSAFEALDPRHCLLPRAVDGTADTG